MKLLTRILIIIVSIIRFFMTTFVNPTIIMAFTLYYRYFRKIDKIKPLPVTHNPILFLPAYKLAKMIRKKEITSIELVQAYINRIKEVDPFLNCVVETRFDEAIKEAKHVDDILASNSIPEKYNEVNAPLLGVPFSCKECIWVKGMSNTSGLVARKDFRAPEDADVVRNMKEAGAILLCVTNTSELCMWMESSNHLHGTTCNPYNLSRIVGGSSGGEACLISGTGSIIGIGSDIGGSIRMPAYFNGVYGHKPSYGIISNNTQHPAASGLQERMLVTGPICRSASDLPLMFKILAGPSAYKDFERKFEQKVDLSKLNYYVITHIDGLLNSKVSPACEKALNKAIQFIENNLNVKVTKLHLKKMKYSFDIWSSMMKNGGTKSGEFSKLLVENSETKKLKPGLELVKSVTRRSYHTLPAIFLAGTEKIPMPNPQKYIQKGNELRAELSSILNNDSILLFPSYPVVAPYHNQPLLTNTLDFIYYGIFNALGFPVTQCPMGLCKKTGLPVGIQVVANYKCDHLTIRLAEYFESNLIGWVPPF